MGSRFVAFVRGLTVGALYLSLLQGPGIVQAAGSLPRVVARLDESQRVEVKGQLHRALRESVDLGAADPSLTAEGIVLVLRSSTEQEAQLAQFLRNVQTRGRPEYHQWLTPQAFGQRFGVADQDVAAVRGWLRSRGFRLGSAAAGRRSVVFSGTVGQLDAAFETRIHAYRWRGERHLANSVNPTIPAALAPVVQGFVSLHDFRLQPQLQRSSLRGQANLTNGTHALGPADFGIIYDLTSNYANGINGAGATIAVIGRSDVQSVDISTFRSTFGLSATQPTVVLAGSDPGLVGNDQLESDLDLEWAGAVAPAASLKFVTANSTSTTDGIVLSAQYAVEQNLADVITVSYGACESPSDVSGGTTFFNQLWQQAAAQGTSVFVSSGDSGAAGCDASASSSATHGLGVNVVCSSPYSTCVGGTQFSGDLSNPSAYWAASNTPGTNASALQYIGESVWNQNGTVTGGSGLWSSGGGVSLYFAKPVWQLATGVPSDGRRDVPDISFAASSAHDPYLIFTSVGNTSSTLEGVGGTSAAAPSMAGIAALITQRQRGRVGSLNPVLYGLSELQAGGGAVVFHRITSGNNSVPGQGGYSASPSDPTYNQATGLGSLDAGMLLAHWADFAGTPSGLKPSNVTVPAAATVGSATLALPSGTSWTAAVGSGASSWLAVTPASGTGSAPLTYSAVANTSSASRTGTITINGQVLTVIQAAANGASQLSLSANSLSFGTDPVGSPSGSQTVLVSNTGGSTLTVGAIVLTGANPADYQFTGTCVAGLTLAAGASCYLRVIFDAQGTGSRGATLQIGSLAVAISGTGTPAAAGDAPMPLWSYALMTLLMLFALRVTGRLPVSRVR